MSTPIQGLASASSENDQKSPSLFLSSFSVSLQHDDGPNQQTLDKRPRPAVNNVCYEQKLARRVVAQLAFHPRFDRRCASAAAEKNSTAGYSIWGLRSRQF